LDYKQYYLGVIQKKISIVQYKQGREDLQMQCPNFLLQKSGDIWKLNCVCTLGVSTRTRGGGWSSASNLQTRKREQFFMILCRHLLWMMPLHTFF